MTGTTLTPPERKLFEDLRALGPLQVDMNDQAGAPPLTEAELQEALSRLDVPPPDLMIALYREFGNGGFGMGYGMIGLGGGYRDDMGATCDELYAEFRCGPAQDPAWEWPHGLLPFCDFGCAIYACIDCTSETANVVIWDPNNWEPDQDPRLGMFASGMGFLDWMQAWASGINLWDHLYESARPMEIYFDDTPPR